MLRNSTTFSKITSFHIRLERGERLSAHLLEMKGLGQGRADSHKNRLSQKWLEALMAKLGMMVDADKDDAISDPFQATLRKRRGAQLAKSLLGTIRIQNN